MGKQALPTEIVARFANKTMAITGYEMDMVMVQPTGQPGAHPTQDVSVPINWAYNPSPSLSPSPSPSSSPGPSPSPNPNPNPSQVPINWAYNHHYEAWMTGRYSA